MSAAHMAEKRVWAAAWKQRRGGRRFKAARARGNAAHSVRMKRTPRLKLRVPLAPRVPFHTVMQPDIFLKKRRKRGGEIFHPAQSRSLIKRRFRLSFGVFTVRLAGNWVLLELIRRRRLELLTGQRGGRPSILLCFVVLLFFFYWK